MILVYIGIYLTVRGTDEGFSVLNFFKFTDNMFDLHWALFVLLLKLFFIVILLRRFYGSQEIADVTICCFCRVLIGKRGPEVIKLVSCSTQLSMKFFLLINVKMPTTVGILIFMSGKIAFSAYLRLRKMNFLIFLYLCAFMHLKFHAQLSWA